MTKEEIVERYGELPTDMKVLEILLHTPSKRLGRPLSDEDMAHCQEVARKFLNKEYHFPDNKNA